MATFAMEEMESSRASDLRRHPQVASGESLEVGFVEAESDGNEIVPVAEEHLVRGIKVPEEDQASAVLSEMVHKIFLDLESLK